MDDLYTKWKTMWDAKEFTTQIFFLIHVFIAFYIASRGMTASAQGSTMAKRGMIVSIGLAYLILVLVGYFQLVPKVNPYG